MSFAFARTPLLQFNGTFVFYYYFHYLYIAFLNIYDT
jgi:hypothetical protein